MNLSPPDPNGMTPATVRAHLDYAAAALTGLYTAAVDDVDPDDADRVRVHLRDDPAATDLATLTGPGVYLTALILRSHTCTDTCTRERGICPVLYLAWVIQGCPEPGKPSTATMEGMSTP